MKRLALLAAFTLAMGLPSALRAQADSALARISALARAGDRSSARQLADSIMTAMPSDARAYPEALYWRGFTAANAAEAERDYLRLAVEYPLSPRSEDALLLLSQLEYARGDRAAALRHLDRLLRDHPNGPSVGRATFWSARVAFDSGDSTKACAALTRARSLLPADDVETRNQVDYFLPRCAVAPVRSDSESATSATRPAVEFSLQVAAFKTSREAKALATRLKARGYDARVTFRDTWYRVRVGRYQSRQEAEAAQARARKAKVVTRVVEAEPR